MVVVDDLQEGLDFAPQLDLPLGHALGHFPGVPVDSGNESVAKRLVGCAFVVGFDDHGLATGVSACEESCSLCSITNTFAVFGTKLPFYYNLKCHQLN